MALKISRILHAGYVFECEGVQIAFDPIFENPFSGNCHAFPNVEFDRAQIKQLQFSAVFISHFHDDHCSLESLNLLNRSTPIYLYCIFEELASWIRELGFTNVQQLELNTSVKVGAFEVIPRRALDADVDSIFHIKAAGLNVLNVVDSWIDEDTLALLKETSWDLALWPFQTMRELEVIAPSRYSQAPGNLPPEWITQLKALNPKKVVPSSCQFIQESWSWYNHALFPISYKQFTQEIQQILPQAQIVRLNPSVGIILSQDSIEKTSPLPWIKPVGDQDVDYDYKGHIKPPTTAEISQNFPALSIEKTERVLEYCRTGILEKYMSMESSEDPYFKKPVLWQLSVYDHTGEVLQFVYQLTGSLMELDPDVQEPLAWSTEISIAKFYAALELGESLTSMYIRINDQFFTPEIESEIQEADIVEDPLIRCLFNGSFGAYQAAQLKRLKGQKST